MKLEDLSPELLEKAQAVNTPEELFELAKEEGVELTEEQLAMVSGGDGQGAIWNGYHPCPECNSDFTAAIPSEYGPGMLLCMKCGTKFWVDWDGTVEIHFISTD